MRRYLAPHGVAAELGVPVPWFNRHRKRLVAEFGFPPPAPGMGLRWDPLAIRLWQDANLPPALKLLLPPAESTGTDWADALDQRAAELGGVA